MAKTKRQVTLQDATIAALELEGIGSLSMGIEFVCRLWMKGTPLKTPTKEKTLDLPDDSGEPAKDGRTVAGERIRAQKEEEAAKAHRALCKDVQLRTLRNHGEAATLDWGATRHPDITDEEWTEALDTCNRNAKAYQKDLTESLQAYREAQEAGRAITPVQSTRLTIQALAGMCLFGTPEAMTDEQINETNEYWEART